MVTVHFSGKDQQNWAGHYGTKFAQTRLRLLLQDNEVTINKESEIILEPKDEDESTQKPQIASGPDNIPIENDSGPQARTKVGSSDDDSESDDD
ncbi:unnamed protein product [Rotaria sordida]|uniref:FBA domain-containing protein n=1 Tax=Rotaria sordida TaxID=392033 RepID=A0A820AWJ2_9BILA|nr:unnamed protein product [Rotaria sordida]CAF4193785.1 unnamed protein product [Rotaria sordida]